MDYFRNIVVVAALAGALAGLGMTVAQQLSTVPLILKAEIYEQSAAPSAHEHGDAAATQAHEHSEDGWSPADGFERTFFSVLANIVDRVWLLLCAPAGGRDAWWAAGRC